MSVLNLLPPGTGIVVCLLQLRRHICVRTSIYRALREMQEVHKCRLLPLFGHHSRQTLQEPSCNGNAKSWNGSPVNLFFPFPSLRNHLSFVSFVCLLWDLSLAMLIMWVSPRLGVFQLSLF